MESSALGWLVAGSVVVGGAGIVYLRGSIQSYWNRRKGLLGRRAAVY